MRGEPKLIFIFSQAASFAGGWGRNGGVARSRLDDIELWYVKGELLIW